jgi:hypothetical protein
MFARRAVVCFAGTWLLCLCGLLGSATISAAAPPPHEQARIEKLIHRVEIQNGMTFVRNGTDYTCQEAAKFLRGKPEAMGHDVSTAREFIDRIASRSSSSGKPCQVRYGDGRLMPAAQFLGEELNRLEALPAW